MKMLNLYARSVADYLMLNDYPIICLSVGCSMKMEMNKRQCNIE